MFIKKVTVIMCLAVMGILMATPIVSAAPNYSTNCQSFMQAINNLPLGGRFEKPDYLISNGSDISDNLWLLKGYLGKTLVDISVKKSDVTNRQLDFSTNSEDDFFDDIIPTINNLYRNPTSKSITPSEKRYVWKYDNYKAVLISKVKDDFTYDISFTADWNYLGHYSAISADESTTGKDFIKAVNDLPLQAQFVKPIYLLPNGSDIGNSFWFYKGNLGQSKIDVRVRQSDLLTRKVEVVTSSADDLSYDFAFAISNIYYQPTTVSLSTSEQKYTWEYFSYKITFASKLNENFRYDISFTAECK